MSGRSKTLTWGLPVIGAAALAGGVILVAANRPVTAQEQPPRQPTTAPQIRDAEPARGANGSEAAEFIGAIGVTEPAGEAIQIAAHRGGVVASVAVRAGDIVETDQPLLTVDEREPERQVAVRESQVLVAEANVQKLRALIPARRAMVDSAKAAVNSAQANVVAAEADLANRANLLRVAESVDDPRAIAAEEVDRRRFAKMQAEARVGVTNAQVEEARAKLAEANADLSLLVDQDGRDGADLRAAQSSVEQARQSLAEAQVELELRTVRAPVAGRVLQINIRPGEFAAAAVPSEGLIVMGREGPPQLRVEIDEVDIARFQKTARAWASPRGDADERYALELAYVEPLVVPKTNLSSRTSERIDTRVLQVVYDFGGAPGLLGVGQQFDVYIETMTPAIKNGGGVSR